MKKSRRSIQWTAGKIIKLIILLAVILAILAAVIMLLRSRVETEFAGDDKEEASSAQVTRGSISTTVTGSGLLSDDDEEKQEIPQGVELETIYVENGELIEEGQLLASVDLNSVLTAMMELTEEMTELDSEINTASIETVNNFVSSTVNGRVKLIYAQPGDSVMDVMAEYGALMVISLDGYLAVETEAPTLSEGEAVTVVSEGGLSYPGKVESVIDGKARVLVDDMSPVCGEAVSVLNTAGETVGSGVFEINDPLKVMGYAGTVDYINVRENAAILRGSALLGLRDTEYTANYERLLKERRETEQELNGLIAIYKEGAIYSELSGTVKEINAKDAEDRESVSADYAETQSSTASASYPAAATDSSGAASSTASEPSAESSSDSGEYFLISPDVTMSLAMSVDESDILSLDIGQSAEVTVDSLDGQSFDGSVAEIDKIGSSDSGVTSYTATITIPKNSAMLAGMSASATVSIEGVENALLIPVDALNKTAASYFVYTSYDAQSGTLGGMVEVSAGISNSELVEITAGLSEGDTVYYYEQEDEGFFMFGGMGGGMPNMGGGGMPPGGGGMPGGMGGRR